MLLGEGKNSHLAAEMLLKTARAWKYAGDQAKASVFYQKTVADGDGWMGGLALWDQADALLQAGKDEQARAVLKTPVGGFHAEQIKIALLSQLGYSYYRTGEWEQAKKYCDETIALSEKAPLLPDAGLEQRVMQAREVLRLIGHWQNRPLICEPLEISTTVAQNTVSQPIAVFFTIRTFGEIPLTISCDDPRLTTRVAPKGVAGDAANYHFLGKDVLVQIAPQVLNQDFETTLLVKSPQFAGFEERVKIRVEVKR